MFSSEHDKAAEEEEWVEKILLDKNRLEWNLEQRKGVFGKPDMQILVAK